LFQDSGDALSILGVGIKSCIYTITFKMNGTLDLAMNDNSFSIQMSKETVSTVLAS
jgi:hypothetical protein